MLDGMPVLDTERMVEDQREHPSLKAVFGAARQLDLGDFDSAHRDLAAVRQVGMAEDTAAGRLAVILAHALAARMDRMMGRAGAGSGNLYERQLGEQDMLAAFQVLLEATPLVSFGHRTSNLAIAEALDGHESAHILDLGIGGGGQWDELLEMLALRSSRPRHLRLTGLDLPEQVGPADARLRKVGQALAAKAASLGVALTFQPLALSLEEFRPDHLDRQGGEPLLVNAAFALHHIADGEGGAPRSGRDAVLERIAALRPLLVTLTEPDADHHEVAFLPRLRSAIAHYGTVFDALAAMLPDYPNERRVVEQAFFGREIANVVGDDDARRFERHERHHVWQRRMRDSGLVPVDLGPAGARLRAGLALHESCTVEAAQHALLLVWRGVPLVAASAWRNPD